MAVTSIHLRPARLADAPVLARLMALAIHWGRLSEFGPAFVRLLHRHMITSRYGIVIAAEQDGVVVGYIAATTDTRRFFREFLWKHGIAAAICVLPSLWHPRRLKTALRGITHFPAAPHDDPPAEALSFAIEPGLKSQGTGTRLFHALADEMRRRHIKVVKYATVDAENAVGNAFYQKLGCRLVRTVPFYRDRLNNVYFYDIDGTT